jgi:hypothetical protein
MLLLLLLLNQNAQEVASMNWIQAAWRLSQDLAKLDSKSLSEIGFSTSSEAMSKFAGVRGITVNTVRRQLSATTFLSSILPPQRFQSLLEKEPPPFNTVEMLKRIRDVNTDLADQLLPSVLNRSITLVEITKQYQAALAEAPQFGKRLSVRRDAAIDFEKTIIETLSQDPSMLAPMEKNGKIIALRRNVQSFAFALPDAMIFSEADGIKRYDAIEIRMPNDWARHQIWQILERINLMATFFTHTWLILPIPTAPDQEFFVENLKSAKMSLGLPSVGIATVETEEPIRFKVLVEPHGIPEIDRRHLLPSF